jgi:sugar (pentulose or hexulose) kinase
MGSTRIKAVLIDEKQNPLASGGFDWENRLENGIWTYRLDDVWAGLREAFAKLAAEVRSKYGAPLTKLAAFGVSAMMHGYLPFGKDGKQLAAFRTWRNTTTEQAAAALTKEFSFNVPQRWSIAHLYQAILNGEEHVKDIGYLTTLSGYVHWQLSGKKVMGVGEASGMFPIDSNACDYDAGMMAKFDELVADKKYGWKLRDIMPVVRNAGDDAGVLTAEGARLLDPSGALLSGCPMCPPEGDAGTGMVATNSVSERTGNVSAGTSIFAMLVLEKALSQVYTEIDMVTTPAGKPVAMVHCNNCTSDFDAWVKLFGEVHAALGGAVSKPALYDAIYFKALEGDADCGGLLSYNYVSGEPVTGLDEGRPLFVRTPDSRFSLANFARSLLFSTMATLKIGMDILTVKENVKLEQLLGHGGLFKTEGVGQSLMAAALDVPVTVMASAGEGGAWGIAVLAAYRAQAKGRTLVTFLAEQVFCGKTGKRVEPDQSDVEGFLRFMERYVKGLAVEREAVKSL